MSKLYTLQQDLVIELFLIYLFGAICQINGHFDRQFDVSSFSAFGAKLYLFAGCVIGQTILTS